MRPATFRLRGTLRPAARFVARSLSSPVRPTALRPAAPRICGTALAVALGVAAPLAAQQIDWPPVLYDPAAAQGDEPADLVLPMPCGGAMAFQRVRVPADAADPLDDERVRLGQASDGAGVVDYLRFAFLRGPFTGQDAAEGTAYYIARYELTAFQHEVLTAGECPSRPSGNPRAAQGGLSWFDAVSLSRRYTEWLYANAPDALPRAGEEPGFVRLPTEAEWEYAARGGASVDEARFAAPRYFEGGALSDHALVAGGTTRGVSTVGTRAPNPLGLYDIYGNVEELTLEPFRLNAAGRPHGQAGGVVTRGGSYAAGPDQVTSARRTEWQAYDRDGQAMAQDSFGVRFVISATASGGEARMRALSQAFEDRLQDPAAAFAAPLDRLQQMIDAEVEADRRAALEGLQLNLAAATRAAADAQKEVVRSTLMSALVFNNSIRDETFFLAQQAELLTQIEAFLAEDHDLDDPVEREQVEYWTAERDATEQAMAARRERRALALTGYRGALELFANDDLDGQVLIATARSLGADLEGRGLGTLAETLDRVLVDIETFAARPDMDNETLLEEVNR